MCVDEEDVGELGDHLRHDRVERVDDQVGELGRISGNLTRIRVWSRV